MRLLKTEFLFIGTISAVIAAFSLLFYFDLTRQIKGDSSEIVGSVTFKRKVAQRKYSSQVVWEEVEQNTPVYNNDSIRTADLSEAVIRLKDGTEIAIDENSMILVAVTNDQVGINFTQGSIKANRGNVSDDKLKKLNISSGGATVSIDKSDISLMNLKGKELSLTVNSGDARIDTGTGEKTVKENQKILASKDELKVFDLKLRLKEPEDQSYITVTAKTRPVNFTWEKITGPYDMTFQISKDGLFENNVDAARVRDFFHSAELKEGAYYWRVVAVNRLSKKMELSEVRKISMVRDDPIQIIAPQNNAAIYYRSKLPIINFKWSESEVTSAYKVQLSSDPEMKNIINISEVTDPFMTLFDLQKGSYYWKVEKIPSIAGLPLKGTSVVSRVVIEKKDEVDPPVLISPDDKKIVSKLVLEKRHLTFSWARNNEIEKYRIMISSDNEFKNSVYDSETENNFIAFNQSLPEGRYYWRVTGLLKEGETTAPSKAWELGITQSEDITLIKPENGEQFSPNDDANRAEINFTWKKIDIEGSFIIEIARNDGFTDIYKTESIQDFYFKDDLVSGKYFWRISMIDTDKKILMKSQKRSFEVLDRLVSPEGITPVDGKNVDMIDKDVLTFSWKKQKGANFYRMSLFQDTDGVKRWITSIDTTDSTCQIGDLKKLDVGGFYWTLQAFDKNPGGNAPVRKSDVSKYSFNITLGKSGKKLKIKTPKLIIIE